VNAWGDILLEFKTRIQYKLAWMLYSLGIGGIIKLPDIKQLYAKAMATKWCAKKDKRFCEEAFYKLYNYDIAKYLAKGEPVTVLSLALYDAERGDYTFSTLRDYAERGVMPAEFALFANVKEEERLIGIIAGILKALGDATPDLIATAWHIIAYRTKTVPLLEKVRENLVLLALLTEMEKKGACEEERRAIRINRRGPGGGCRYMDPAGGKKAQGNEIFNSVFLRPT